MARTGWQGLETILLNNVTNVQWFVNSIASRMGVTRSFFWYSMLTRLQRLLCMLVLSLLCFWGFTPPAQAVVSYEKASFIKSDFSGQDLHGISFDHSNMQLSTFKGSNLNSGSFFAANLTAADLSDTDMTRVTLDTARLSKANLTNAVLVGAFATNTKFDGAIVDGADFTDVLLRRDIQLLLCKTAKGTNPKTGRETRVTLDCP
jgi:uncharacterized protein YjbI with pentapeptide repeats